MYLSKAKKLGRHHQAHIAVRKPKAHFSCREAGAALRRPEEPSSPAWARSGAAGAAGMPRERVSAGLGSKPVRPLGPTAGGRRSTQLAQRCPGLGSPAGHLLASVNTEFRGCYSPICFKF